MEGVQFGNTAQAGAASKQWIVGRFIHDPMRYTEDVSIKWSHHRDGDRKNRGFTEDTARAITILVRGRIREWFRRGNELVEYLLENEGDFVASIPGQEHDWKVEADDTVVVTIRWPSRSPGT